MKNLKRLIKQSLYLSVFLLLYVFLSCHSADNEFHIRFTIDKAYDKSMIISIFTHSDPAGLVSRAESMHFPVQLAEAISSDTYNEAVMQKLNKRVNIKYTQYSSDLHKALLEYQKLWEPLDSVFAEKIYKLTGSSLFYNEYICVVSLFHPGISSWYGNTIAVKYNYSQEDKIWYTAWEITLSHIFHIVRTHYDRMQADDWTVWAFSEVAASFVLRDTSLQSFWPDKNIDIERSYFQDSNYPQLTETEQILKRMYLENRSFKKFMKIGIEYLNQNKIVR